MEAATVDVISGGKAFGATAARILEADFQPARLRTNDVLPIEVWKQFDQVLIQEALLRMVGVNDLLSRGLEYDLRSVGLGKTVLQWQTFSDIGGAEISMDGLSGAARDRGLFNYTNLLPLFITHKDVSFTLREIKEAQSGGQPIDTSNIALAMRKVAESVETLLFQGPSKAIQLPTVWGNAIAYGYTDAPHRATDSLSGAWDSATDPTDIKNDVLAMKQAAIGNRMYGPYMMYIPTEYEKVMDDDYAVTTSAITTVRERILMIDGIQGVKVADFLPAGQVLLVQMTRDVVDMVVCVDPMIVPWEEVGGMRLNFKVMTVMVPRMKLTQANRSGIVHFSE